LDLSPIKRNIIATLCLVEVASAVGVVRDGVARLLVGGELAVAVLHLVGAELSVVALIPVEDAPSVAVVHLVGGGLSVAVCYLGGDWFDLEVALAASVGKFADAEYCSDVQSCPGGMRDVRADQCLDVPVERWGARVERCLDVRADQHQADPVERRGGQADQYQGDPVERRGGQADQYQADPVEHRDGQAARHPEVALRADPVGANLEGVRAIRAD
jgi:hypothetical protein